MYLKALSITRCTMLKVLCDDFHCLTSLQHLYLSFCFMLEGKSMDHVVKMTGLRHLRIEESKHLVKRWAKIQKDGDGSWSSEVISRQVIISWIHIYDTKNVIASILLTIIINIDDNSFSYHPQFSFRNCQSWTVRRRL